MLKNTASKKSLIMWDLVGKITVSIFAARIGYSFLKGIYGSFLGSLLGLSTNFRKLGKWAGNV